MTIGITLVVSVVLGRLRIQNKRIRYIITGIIGIALIMTIASTLSNMSTVRANSATLGNLNGVGILLFVALAVVIFLIGTVLHVGGVRYALEGQGLFDPPGNVQFLLKSPRLTGILILNGILFISITVLAVTIGTMLFVLPGLVALVVCTIMGWYLLTHYVVMIRSI